MEYMGDTIEDAFVLLYEEKELPRHDWEEYFQRWVHRFEQHPMVFFHKQTEEEQ